MSVLPSFLSSVPPPTPPFVLHMPDIIPIVNKRHNLVLVELTASSVSNSGLQFLISEMDLKLPNMVEFQL